MEKEILVVDDEPKNLKLLSDVLMFSGYKVYAAKDGQEAVDMAMNFKPNLILMDLQLPVLDGVSAARILKNNPETSTIPILVLSGGGVSDEKFCDCEGLWDGFIAKPFNLKSLRNIVKQYL